MTESKNFLEEIIEADLIAGPGGIITRFPPEPNGYLHIGHAKSICINFGLAAKYGGECNLRYDDTNPSKEDEEYVRSIEADIKWLGFSWDKKLFASDYFEYMFECAVTLINKGLAYVCELDSEQMRATRGTLTEPGKNSPFRDRVMGENLDLFLRMRAGEFADGKYVLRAKIDMSSPNINMRDPIIYRILRSTHHRTGDDWLIYPMYDFAHPLEDAIEGITHSICTLEFEDHRPLYDWVVANCDCENVPHQFEFARLGMTRTIMSKRYLKRLVDEKIVGGWDDPRMPTISGLRRRGYTPAAIRDFCARVGVAKANSEVDVRFLEHCVREDLNTSATRAMAVIEPLRVVIENYPENKTEVVTLENLPLGEDGANGVHECSFGREIYIEREDFIKQSPNNKWFRLAPGKEVRLKGAYIIKAVGCDEDDEGNVTCVYCTYDPDSKSGGATAGRKVKGTLHWVEKNSAVAAQFRLYDYLLNDGEGDFTERANPNSLEIKYGLVEPFLKAATPEERFQFMRIGYFCADYESTPQNPVFNRIVNLKDSFKIL